jgi:hypothetical protein
LIPLPFPELEDLVVVVPAVAAVAAVALVVAWREDVLDDPQPAMSSSTQQAVAAAMGAFIGLRSFLDEFV